MQSREQQKRDTAGIDSGLTEKHLHPRTPHHNGNAPKIGVANSHEKATIHGNPSSNKREGMEEKVSNREGNTITIENETNFFIFIPIYLFFATVTISKVTISKATIPIFFLF